MSQELISIIVPIYNAEKYLADCIESLIRQTYTTLEILLIDNGSNDKSLDICRKYEKGDTRIRVLQEGVRQHGSARNKGLSEMKGRYYAFVDADDYVSVNYISYMYDAAKRFEADLVQCGVVYMYECRDERRNSEHSTHVVDGEKDLPKSVWGKLYNSTIHGNVRFTDMLHGEDSLYITEILKSSRKAALTAYCLYGYRSYHSGLTRLTPDKAFFEKLESCIADMNQTEFSYMAEKCIQVISLRGEEQLYHKELQRLNTDIQKAQNNSIQFDTELYCKLQEMIEKSQVSVPKYVYLKLKHIYTDACAKHRLKINYHCKLD